MASDEGSVVPTLLALLLTLAAQHAAPVEAAGPHEPIFAERVLAELNRARSRPSAVAADLRRYARTFREHVAYEDSPDRAWPTQEGPSAVEEAALLLDRQPALGSLLPSAVLTRSARDHAREQARDGGTGHRSADGSGPGDRAVRAGGDRYVSEAIAYGFETPERAVRQLIVDDGVPRRGHRVLVLGPRLRYAGVGCATHPRWRTVCVVDVAETPDGGPAVPPRGP